MKRFLTIVLTVAICVCAFSGCSRQEADPAFFSSYMLSSPDHDEPGDDEIEEAVLSSDALFAFDIFKGETTTVQTVYVWKNLLRRELRLDLLQIYDALPDKDKNIVLEIGEEIKVNGKAIGVEPTSELSFAMLRVIFPEKSQVNAKDLMRTLREMIIRLETYASLGDTEVIAIQTIAHSGMLLENRELWNLTLVNDLDEITELKSVVKIDIDTTSPRQKTWACCVRTACGAQSVRSA